jgi:hypothetical protein
LQRDLRLLLEKGLIRESAAALTDPNRSYVPDTGARRRDGRKGKRVP